MSDPMLCPQSTFPFEFCDLPTRETVGRLVSRFLLEGVRIRQFSRTVTGTREASREVGCPAECYEHSSIAPVGLARSRDDLAVSDGPTVFPEYRPPLSCDNGFILS